MGDIRGLGLFIGIEMVAERKAKTPDPQACRNLQARAREAGLVVGIAGNYGNVLRLCPPLSIHRSEVEMAHGKLIAIFKLN